MVRSGLCDNYLSKLLADLANTREEPLATAVSGHPSFLHAHSSLVCIAFASGSSSCFDVVWRGVCNHSPMVGIDLCFVWASGAWLV